jgi:hypothetical protein
MQQDNKQQQEALKEYEALLEMFDTEGWRIFQREAEDSLRVLTEQAPMDCITNEQWQLRRGEIQKLKQIAGFQQFTKESYDLLTNEPEETEDWAYD